MLVYVADLPALPESIGDITSRKLVVTAEGTEVFNADVDMSATTSPEFSVEQGHNVTLSLTYTDDAGNVSAPSEQSFVAADTIAPDAPGPFGEVRMVREE